MPLPVSATMPRRNPQRILPVTSNDAALAPRPAVRLLKAGARAHSRQHPDAFVLRALVTVSRRCARRATNWGRRTGGTLPGFREVQTSDSCLRRRSHNRVEVIVSERAAPADRSQRGVGRGNRKPEVNESCTQTEGRRDERTVRVVSRIGGGLALGASTQAC